MVTALLLALVPIALLIACGALLQRRAFVADSFWPQAERLGYYVLLPALFLHSLATADLSGLPVLAMAACLVLSILIVAALLVVFRRFLALTAPAFTSVFQGGVRFNNYVGVSAAAGIFGAQGVALAAVANAAIVPTVNVLCVLVFARYCNRGVFTLRAALQQLLLNPLVLACVIGIALQTSGVGLHSSIEPFFKALGQASLPLGLLCVGAALHFSSAPKWLQPIAMASCVKLVLMPLVTVAVCQVVGLSGTAAIAVLLFQSLPTASSSYIMARQLGGDAPLMAAIIASQTVLAALTIPLALLWLTS